MTELSRRRAGGLELTWGADQGGEEGLWPEPGLICILTSWRAWQPQCWRAAPQVQAISFSPASFPEVSKCPMWVISIHLAPTSSHA